MSILWIGSTGSTRWAARRPWWFASRTNGLVERNCVLSLCRSVGTDRCCQEGGMSLGVINIADLCNLTHFRSPSATITTATTRSIFLLCRRVFLTFRDHSPRSHHIGSFFLRLPVNHHVRTIKTFKSQRNIVHSTVLFVLFRYSISSI